MTKVTEFLNAIGHGEHGQLIEVRKPGQGSDWYDSVAQVEAAMPGLLGLKTNLYVGACPRFTQNGKKEGVNLVVNVWADLDGKSYPGGKAEALATIQAFPLKPTALVDSGNGYHPWWRLAVPVALAAPLDLQRVELVLKALAHALKSDPSVAEVARIMRLPGSLNWKDPKNPKPVEVVEMDATRIYSLEDFRPYVADLLAVTPTATKSDAIFDFDARMDSPLAALADLAEGNRHATFLAAAGSLIARGYGYDDALVVLLPWAREAKFPDDELERIVRDVAAKHPTEETAVSASHASPPPLGGDAGRTADPNEIHTKPYLGFMAEPDHPVQWIIEGRIPEVGIGIGAGRSYVGKSFAWYDAMLAVATETPWGPNRTFLHPVVLVDQDCPDEDETRRRLRKLARGRGIPDDQPLPITIGYADLLKLDTPAGAAALDRLLAANPGSFVVIDCLIRVFSGEENSASDMKKLSNAVMGLVRKHRCFVMFIDHLGKNTSQGAGSTLRGTTEKFAFADVIYEFHGEEGSNEMTVTNKKLKRGRPAPPFRLRIADRGENIVIEWLDGEPETFQIDRDDEVRDFIRHYVRTVRREVARPELVAEGWAQKKLNKNRIDAVLPGMVPGDLTMQQRKNAQGKWTHYYRTAQPGDQLPLPPPTAEGDTMSP